MAILFRRGDADGRRSASSNVVAGEVSIAIRDRKGTSEGGQNPSQDRPRKIVEVARRFGLKRRCPTPVAADRLDEVTDRAAVAYANLSQRGKSVTPHSAGSAPPAAAIASGVGPRRPEAAAGDPALRCPPALRLMRSRQEAPPRRAALDGVPTRPRPAPHHRYRDVLSSSATPANHLRRLVRNDDYSPTHRRGRRLDAGADLARNHGRGASGRQVGKSTASAWARSCRQNASPTRRPMRREGAGDQARSAPVLTSAAPIILVRVEKLPMMRPRPRPCRPPGRFEASPSRRRNRKRARLPAENYAAEKNANSPPSQE